MNKKPTEDDLDNCETRDHPYFGDVTALFSDVPQGSCACGEVSYRPGGPPSGGFVAPLEEMYSIGGFGISSDGDAVITGEPPSPKLKPKRKYMTDEDQELLPPAVFEAVRVLNQGTKPVTTRAIQLKVRESLPLASRGHIERTLEDLRRRDRVTPQGGPETGKLQTWSDEVPLASPVEELDVISDEFTHRHVIIAGTVDAARDKIDELRDVLSEDGIAMVFTDLARNPRILVFTPSVHSRGQRRRADDVIHLGYFEPAIRSTMQYAEMMRDLAIGGFIIKESEMP